MKEYGATPTPQRLMINLIPSVLGLIVFGAGAVLVAAPLFASGAGLVGGIALVIVDALFALFFAWAIVRILRRIKVARELDEDGKPTQATIVDKEAIERWWGQSTYVTYQIEDIKIREKVPADRYKTATQGETITVKQLPSQPTVVRWA